jgi:hypothetical protein
MLRAEAADVVAAPELQKRTASGALGEWIDLRRRAGLEERAATCCMSSSSGKFVKSNHSEEGADELYVK